MTKQDLLGENEQLRAQLSEAQETRAAQYRSFLTAAEEGLQAEIAEHLEDKQKLLQQKGSEYR